MAADGGKIIARAEKLRGARQQVSEVWRECYDYSFPIRGAQLAQGPGAVDGLTLLGYANDRQANLLDSTSRDAARTLAAGLQAGETPANSLWAGLASANATDVDKRWLENAARTMWQNIHASNFDAVGYECQLDMVVAGMFALFCDEAPDGGYQFAQWPLAECLFASSIAGGPIDTVYREFGLTAEQAVHEYGENMVSEQTRKLAEAPGSKDEQVQFCWAIYPSGKRGTMARNMPIASIRVERQTKKVVHESGYQEMPVIVPRWMQVPGSVYAVGPMYDALPDVKTLNEVVKYTLANMDLAVAGIWGAVDDGVLNPRTIRIRPRGVIVMASKDSLWPLQPASRFQEAFLEIERLQKNIRRVLMADQLEPQDGPQRTAYEVQVRVEMVRQILSPMYGRQQSEYLQPLIERCFGLAYRAGVFGPAPRSLLGANWFVEYRSPLARAQKLVDVSAMDRYEMSLGAQLQAGLTDAVDVYQWDDARRKRAELLGVPADLIPDQDDVDERRKGRAEQQQQAQQQQMMGEVMVEKAKAA